jgi:preprotein translocase subunit SecE
VTDSKGSAAELSGSADPEKSTGAASKSSKTATKERRGNPFARIGRFMREIVAELRKVIYPTRNELVTYTIVVIVFLAIMTSIVFVLDWGFAKAILWAFGNPSGGDQ